jgi:hypothetical protein
MEDFQFSAGDGLKPTRQVLAIPDYPGLIEASGRLAIAHTHLELALRHTVKVLSGLSVRQALDATSEERTSDTRKRLRRLFAEKQPTPTEIAHFDALLGKAKRLAEKRNNYLHTAWSVSAAGLPVIKLEDHSWGLAPTQEEVMKVASEIVLLGVEINNERLHGFINRVANRTSSAQEEIPVKEHR